MTSMNKKTKAGVVSAIIIGIVIVAAICLTLIFLGRSKTTAHQVAEVTSQDDLKVNGEYKIAIASGDNNSTVMAINFDESSMTYSKTLSAGDLTDELASGSYQIDEDNYQVICKPESGDQESFYIYGDNLVAMDYIYSLEDGQDFLKSSEGQTIDATYTYSTSDGTSSSIEFKSDGTYSDSNGNTGEYSWDGYYIKRSADNGSELVDLLITDKGLSNSYFTK